MKLVLLGSVSEDVPYRMYNKMGCIFDDSGDMRI
jgi:hypothetical protein